MNSINMEIRSISKSFGKTMVLKNISILIDSHCPLVLVGDSGCGKSTLLRLIAGLEIPDEGEIFINGRIVSSRHYIEDPWKRGIAYVFQSAALWPNMTIEENIYFGLGNLGKENMEKAAMHYLEGMGIGMLAKRYPSEVSGGEARRASIARALAAKRQILLMDEPLTNLNETIKNRVLEFIKKEIVSHNPCVIYVTHDLWEGQSISNRIVRLESGCFV